MTLPPRYEKYLEDLHENIKCLSFNSVVPFFSLKMNNRDHRKLMIIDGKTEKFSTYRPYRQVRREPLSQAPSYRKQPPR